MQGRRATTMVILIGSKRGCRNSSRQEQGEDEHHRCCYLLYVFSHRNEPPFANGVIAAMIVQSAGFLVCVSSWMPEEFRAGSVVTLVNAGGAAVSGNSTLRMASVKPNHEGVQRKWRARRHFRGNGASTGAGIERGAAQQDSC